MKGGWGGGGLSEVLKEKVVRGDRQERIVIKMLGEQKKGEKHRREEEEEYYTKCLALSY